MLEGRSRPDACFETDAMLVVIEGKRTERKATAVTTWMRTRSQMLRHMDAALEISRGKSHLVAYTLAAIQLWAQHFL